MGGRTIRGIWLGRRPYAPVLSLQNALREAVHEGAEPNTLLLLEHEPVITLGRGARRENLLVSEGHLSQRGVEIFKTDRGGDITLHAPGQLVGYPIVALSPDRCDVRRYVGDLAETMRRVVAPFGIAAGPVAGMVGLWTDPERPDRFDATAPPPHVAKIGAIGVRISRWVTMHGFALNLTTDLSLFGLIVPCGISQHGVTSVQALTGERPSVRDMAARALRELASILDASVSAFDDWSERPLDVTSP